MPKEQKEQGTKEERQEKERQETRNEDEHRQDETDTAKHTRDTEQDMDTDGSLGAKFKAPDSVTRFYPCPPDLSAGLRALFHPPSLMLTRVKAIIPPSYA